MEGENGHDHVKQQGQGQGQGQAQQSSRSAASSISDLFGDRDPRSNGVFQSVYSASSVPPPSSSSSSSSSSSQWSSSAKGNGTPLSEESWRKDGNDQTNENTQYASSETSSQKDKIQGVNIEHVETVEPFFLSSSLYYGGQDICAPSPTSQASGSLKFSKDSEEDDPISNSSNSASRGNWWQGSLYY